MEMPVLDYQQLSEDYRRIEQAIVYLEKNYQQQPSLGEVAESVHLSEYHFQRLFTRWAGVSPKRFLQYLTKEHAKRLLTQASSLLDATYATGLSGPSRLHDLFVTCEAVTPGEYKSRGEGLEIVYGFHLSPFGECLLALTGRGICGLSFVLDGDRRAAVAALQAKWKNASLQEDAEATQPVFQQVFAHLQGQPSAPLHLYLHGTNFQLKVWEALLQIPSGSVVSYDDIAVAIGMPGAARAVGNAVAQNPVPVLIPCHRVIRKMGALGSYHWGAARKKAMLGWEMAHREG